MENQDLIKKLIELEKQYPNNYDLGSHLRKLIIENYGHGKKQN
jgi:hypothetical protein